MNPIDAQYLESFCDALVAEYFEVAAFVELLQSEQRAIQEGAAMGIERLQPEKQARMVAIRDHASRRATCLRELGYGAGASAIAKLLRDHPALERRVDPTWRTLVSKAWEASHLIRLNTHLIDIHVKHAQGRLTALVGAAAPERSVYDPRGTVATALPGRSLAQA